MNNPKSKRDEALEIAKTLRNDLYEGQKPVSSLLRVCKTICKYLGISDQNEWIDLELNGYYNKYKTIGDLQKNAPTYRKALLTFFNANNAHASYHIVFSSHMQMKGLESRYRYWNQAKF